jgi:hypothetical protein
MNLYLNIHLYLLYVCLFVWMRDCVWVKVVCVCVCVCVRVCVCIRFYVHNSIRRLQEAPECRGGWDGHGSVSRQDCLYHSACAGARIRSCMREMQDRKILFFYMIIKPLGSYHTTNHFFAHRRRLYIHVCLGYTYICICLGYTYNCIYIYALDINIFTCIGFAHRDSTTFHRSSISIPSSRTKDACRYSKPCNIK